MRRRDRKTEKEAEQGWDMILRLSDTRSQIVSIILGQSYCEASVLMGKLKFLKFKCCTAFSYAITKTTDLKVVARFFTLVNWLFSNIGLAVEKAVVSGTHYA